MKLPKIATPTYELTLPSNGTKIKYRPFLVPEEKLFLLTVEGLSKDPADESKNKRSILQTMQNVIDNCIISPEINSGKLPIFDLMYIFVQLRARSISDKLDLYFDGKKDSACEECKKQKHVQVDLTQIQIKKNEKHTNKIQITKEVGLVLKYPSFDLYAQIETRDKLSDIEDDLIIGCIESIYDSTNIYDAKDCSREELIEWLNQLNKKQLSAVNQFFETMPRMYHKVEIKCDKCGAVRYYEMENIEDFFE